MATLTELMVKIGADSTGLNESLKKAKGEINNTFGDIKPVQNMTDALTGTSNAVEGLFGRLTKFATVAAGGFGLTALISSAVEAGEKTYQLSNRLNITTGEAGQLSKIMSQTGGDCDTAARAIMRLDQTLASGNKTSENAKKWLDAFGISLTDANGKMLPLNKQLELLAGGYQKAREAGYHQEFIMNTLGVRGMALTNTLLNYTEAKNNASKVQSIGLDPKQMHEVDQQMKVVNMQLGQFKNFMGATLAPIAADVLPKIYNEMAYGAKVLKENKEQIQDTARALVTVIALYKSMKAAQGIATKIGGLFSSASETKQAEVQENALTKAQERAIKRRTANIEAEALREQKAYAKSVSQMAISEEEKTKLVQEHVVKRTILAEEAANKERQIMTAMFLKINAERRASGAEAEASYAKTATASEIASARIRKANAQAGASAREIVVGNEMVIASEAEKATASELSGLKKVEASAKAKVATAEEMVANQELTVSEIATGNAATEAGTKKVLADSRSKVSTDQLTVAQTAQKVQVMQTGTQATVTGVKLRAMATGALGGVSRLTSAVWALAGGWMGVAVAIGEAASALYSFYQHKQANINKNAVKMAGEEYRYNEETGKWQQKVADSSGGEVSQNYGNMLLASFFLKDTNDAGSKYVDVRDAEKIGELNNKREEVNPEFHAKQEAERAELEALQAGKAGEDDLKRVLAELASAGAGGSDSSGSGGSAGSVAKALKEAEQKKTVYSLLASGSYAPYANQIEYTAKQWGYDPNLLAALFLKENAGANPLLDDYLTGTHHGFGQISDDIWNQYKPAGATNVYDANANIWAAGSHLGDLITKFDGDIRMALAAYNAGEAGARAGYGQEYANDILNRYSSATTYQVSGNGSVTEQPTIIQVPVGQRASQIAMNDFSEGQGWMGDFTDNPRIQCDSFTANIYANAGIKDIGGYDPTKGVINDQAFRSAGAYHEAGDGYTPEAGDLLDADESRYSHVGIYLGNGKVRSRDSSNGVTTWNYDDWVGHFGLSGIGSIREATGGMTVGMSGNRQMAAMNEAIKKYQDAVQKMNQLSGEMMSAIHNENGTEYQKEYLKVVSDINKKHKELNELKLAGVDTSKAENILLQYQEMQINKLVEANRKANKAQELENKSLNAQVAHAYSELADIEYQITLNKLDEERKQKEKSLMKDKGDADARWKVTEWYYSQIAIAEEKRIKARREGHEKEIQYLQEEGNLAGLITKLNPNGGINTDRQNSIFRKGQQDLAKFYVKVWDEAHSDVSSAITQVSESVYGSLSDSMAEFIKGTKSAKEVFKDFGNSIISTMAKIAAQRLAANWVTGLLGMFGHGSSTASVSSVGNFGIGSSSITNGLMSGFKSASSTLWATPKFFASGGIVTAPTLGMIGESGEHEAVIPLNENNLRALGGKGGGVVVNITNKSDNKVEVKNSQFDEGMQKWVLDVVVDGAQRNKGGFNTNLKTALGAK